MQDPLEIRGKGVGEGISFEVTVSISRFGSRSMRWNSINGEISYGLYPFLSVADFASCFVVSRWM